MHVDLHLASLCCSLAINAPAAPEFGRQVWLSSRYEWLKRFHYDDGASSILSYPLAQIGYGGLLIIENRHALLELVLGSVDFVSVYFLGLQKYTRIPSVAKNVPSTPQIKWLQICGMSTSPLSSVTESYWISYRVFVDTARLFPSRGMENLKKLRVDSGFWRESPTWMQVS